MTPGLSGLSLKGLEIFEALAETGSVAKAAELTGLSLPAVSQQMKKLEMLLGVELVNHATRPMVLTPSGRIFLRRTQEVLRQLGHAKTDLAMLDLAHLTSLSLGVIEDFDGEVTPRLVTALAKNMTTCEFKLMTGASHDILRRVQSGSLDIGIAAAMAETPSDLVELPVLRDPFLMIVPKGFALSDEPLTDLATLNFLRRDRDQILGRQIEQHLARHKLRLEAKFEMDSNQSIGALVAAGNAWTITTPLGLFRGRRFLGQIDAHPLPVAKFARVISVFARRDWIASLPADIAGTLRGLMQEHVVELHVAALPWLAEDHRVIAA